MDAKVFVYVAHKDGKADDSALELASAAKTLFPGAAPVAIVAGSGVDAVCQEAATACAEVWKFDQTALAYPNAELLRPLLVIARQELQGDQMADRCHRKIQSRQHFDWFRFIDDLPLDAR